MYIYIGTPVGDIEDLVYVVWLNRVKCGVWCIRCVIVDKIRYGLCVKFREGTV